MPSCFSANALDIVDLGAHFNRDESGYPYLWVNSWAKQMRFHKAELAFFLFMIVLLMTGGVLFAAYSIMHGGLGASEMDAAGRIGRVQLLVFAGGSLIAAALLLGILFIFPLIRIEVREQGKLREMTQSLSARSDSLEHAALTDALTGMQNRRYFDDALKEYLEEFRRIGKPVGLMVLDLDHFKSVNDTHGHDVGDEVLRRVAQCLKDFTRYHDVAARVGGEEFAVVAPNMDLEILQKFAERIRKAISELVIESGNVRLKVTSSFGLALWDGREAADAFYKRADKMLYQAKTTGRNRVCA
jgi:two-component system, cell cycle response regulator